ncbi:OLC1v1016795C1 [Oldenlandia corymbosa var. corymbosa]|uniref:OLC1v1016795C1 n=1 Tax=Oldenlandia corymbosa var. corymbosa TaxID=529605 RepID=A0AAV1E7Y5_OLDCO|nr:OLC1v1016795C1 [Oldenlandia corymbosa var. corymbosa]
MEIHWLCVGRMVGSMIKFTQIEGLQTNRIRRRKARGARKETRTSHVNKSILKWDFRQPDGPPQDVVQQNIYEYVVLERIVPCMIPYINGYVDVLGDGNCGFRVVASHLFGSEHQWHNARRIGANELEKRSDLYDFFFERDIPKHVHHIRWYESPCSEDHYMITFMDLLMYAIRFNMVIFLYRHGVRSQNMNTSSSTILPLIAPRGSNGPLTGPVREITIAHLGDYKHYIRLDFVGSDFLVLSIPYQWFCYRDTFVMGWEHPYLKRIDLWHTLCPDNRRTQSSQSYPFNVE